MTRTLVTDQITHDQLADLVREFLLCGHLIDRASMPHILSAWGREEMRDIAVDEWMGASPIYTRRMQRLLRFVGTDVTTIFKGMQFDIGAPPQFMDFRYEVHDAAHGKFWLDHCGALMDVEPMGEDYVFTMCHEIEDPTFDATACATNPRARMRPIHRPPRIPSDRHPHCAWTVTIDPDEPPVAEPEMAELMATTRAAAVPLAEIFDDGTDGLESYAGPFVTDIDFTAFSTSALLALADEVALQGQLLSLAGLLSIAGRHGDEAAEDIGRHQLTGVAGVAAARIRERLGLGSTLSDAANVLMRHPAFLPRSYVSLDVRVEPAVKSAAAGDVSVAQDGSGAPEAKRSEVPGATVDPEVLTVSIGACPALEDPSGLTWAALLVSGDSAGAIDVIVQAVDPHLRSRRVVAEPGAVATFEVTRSDSAAPTASDVELASFSTGADFSFADEGTRVQIRLGRTHPT